MSTQYRPNIMEALVNVLELDGNETKQQLREMYTQEELLEAVLSYEGIQGYTNRILDMIEDIFEFDVRMLND